MVHVEHEEKSGKPEETMRRKLKMIHHRADRQATARDVAQRIAVKIRIPGGVRLCARGVQHYVAAGPVIHKYLMSNKQHGGIT